MKVFLNGRLNIRPLVSEDKPNMALPYDAVSYWKPLTSLADNAVTTITLSSDDWGSGLDWITFMLLTEFISTANFNVNAHEGIRLLLYNDTTADTLYIFSAESTQWKSGLRSTTAFLSIPHKLYPGAYTSSNQTLTLNITNGSGQALTGNMYFIGMAI